MEIKNPEYILEIARQRSVTRAAETLFLTQSTLSQYLLKLESDLGTPLFTREKNGLVPTAAGQVYLQAAQAVVGIQDTAEANIAALKKEGFLSLGVSFWGLMLLTELLPRFKDRFPNITLRLSVENYAHLKRLLQDGKIDLALISVTEDDDRPAQGALPLCREELVLVMPCGAPYCLSHMEDTPIPIGQLPAALEGTRFVAPDTGSSIFRIEEKLFRELVYHPDVICKVEREDTAARMVSAGVGAAILSVEDVQDTPRVRAFRLDPPLYRENILVLRRGADRTGPLAYLESQLLACARRRAAP
jgi:LysR family transcriptional activator of glutamate synthase operon